MNEAETRAEHIDPALTAAGWGVVEGSRIRREYPITLGRIEGRGRRGKPLIADYVLIHRNHKLAVVEARPGTKKLPKGRRRPRTMPASSRSATPTRPTGRVFTRSTCGMAPKARRRAFTPDELWNRTFAEANAWRARFAAVPFEDRGGFFQGRYYQDIANDRVLEAIASGK